MKNRRKSSVQLAPKKKKISWFPVTMFCFGIVFIASALVDRSRGIAGHYSKGAFVTWQQSLVAGIVAVIGATYALMTKTKREQNQTTTANDLHTD